MKYDMSQNLRSALYMLCAFVAGAAVFPLAVLLISFLGWMPADAVGVPSALESAIAQSGLRASLAHRSEGLADTINFSYAELIAGMQLFRNGCSGCHGDLGTVSHWGDNNFYPRAPQFAYTPPSLTAPEMFTAVKYGVRYSGMFANEKMPEKDIWRIVTFLSRLNSLPPAVNKAWRAKH